MPSLIIAISTLGLLVRVVKKLLMGVTSPENLYAHVRSSHIYLFDLFIAFFILVLSSMAPTEDV